MAGLLAGLLGGLLGGRGGPSGTTEGKDTEDAVTGQVLKHYEDSKEPSSTLAPSGISNVISQDERLQLISPNQMIHTDFTVNPDIGAQSRQSTQITMNQVAFSSNEIVFEFASNQNLMFMKDMRLELEINIDNETVPPNNARQFPVNRITGGQFWWTQFFNQLRVEINGGQVVTTDIGALRAIMLASQSLNPNDGIDVGAIRRHIEADTLNGGDYTQEIDLETSPTGAIGAGLINYQGTKFYQRVSLPLTFFDIKDLLAPNTILRITFVRNPAPICLFASSGQGTGLAGSVTTQRTDLRIWSCSLSAMSQWLTDFEVNPAKARADTMAHIVSGTPNQLVWYLPQHLSYPMTSGQFQPWTTYFVPGGGPYSTYTQEFTIQGTGVAANQYVVVPEVTWQVFYISAANTLTATNQTWTEVVPGLATLEKVSINSVDMNYPTSILPTNVLTSLASGTFQGYMNLLKYRSRAAISERFSQKQLSKGTWKRYRQWMDHRSSPNLGYFTGPVLGGLPAAADAIAAANGEMASQTYAQIPWEKLRNAPLTIVNTVLNEDPFVVITPQRGTIRITLRLLQNFMSFASNVAPLVPGTILPQVAIGGINYQDNVNTNVPYIPYVGEPTSTVINNTTSRILVLKNPTLTIRFVSMNITMTEYGENGMTVTNTNLYERLGAVGGV
jgi:hypothetical protein